MSWSRTIPRYNFVQWDSIFTLLIQQSKKQFFCTCFPAANAAKPSSLVSPFSERGAIPRREFCENIVQWDSIFTLLIQQSKKQIFLYMLSRRECGETKFFGVTFLRKRRDTAPGVLRKHRPMGLHFCVADSAKQKANFLYMLSRRECGESKFFGVTFLRKKGDRIFTDTSKNIFIICYASDAASAIIYRVSTLPR